MPHFEQLIKDCEDIKLEISKFAEKKNISAKEIDYLLIDATLYMKSKPEEGFTEATPDSLSKLRSEEGALDENLQVKQRYTVKLIPKAEAHQEFEVKLLADDGHYRVVAKVNLISAKKNEFLIHDIYNEIKRKKAYFGILIGVFEDGLKERIRDAISQPGNHFELDVCKSPAGEKSVNAEVIYAFQKTDIPAANHIVFIKSGDKVATFTKKKTGSIGRNCNGEIIKPGEPSGGDESPVNAGEGIEVKEDETKIEYFANKNGYLVLNEPDIMVENDMELASLNLAQTGSILAGIDSGTSLKIGAVEGEDAIGDGVRVEVENLEVIGNIGKAAKIKCKTLKVDGLTHMDSTIEAEEVNIKTHKGKLVARHVVVERVEGGTVECEEAIISKISGGTVSAKTIKAIEIYSNVHLIASSLVEIENIKGEDNKITIEPGAYFVQNNEILELTDEMGEIMEGLKKDIKDFKERSSFINSTLGLAKELKKELDKLKNTGAAIPKVLKEKMLEYNRVLKEAKELNGRIKQHQARITDIKKVLATYDKETRNAVVVNHNIWLGYNEVRFKLLESDKTFFMVPKEGDKTIKLYQDEDGETVLRGYVS